MRSRLIGESTFTEARWWPTVVAVAVFAAIGVALASAPVALGDSALIGENSLTANNGSAALLGQNVPVFQGDATAGTYVVRSPVLGTLTSWSFMSGGVAQGKNFALAVLRPSGANWQLVATSAPQAVTSTALNDVQQGPFTLTPGINIQAGDRIGLMPIDDVNTPYEQGTNKDGIRYFSQPFTAPNTTQALAPGATADNAQVVPIQATVSYISIQTLPAITGSAVTGQTLSCSQGQWSEQPDTYSYQWLSDGTPISGATTARYTIPETDAGHQLSCQVAVANSTPATGQAVSLATDPVKPGPAPAPQNTKVPSVTGTARQFENLTGDPGLWRNGVTSYTYAWLRCATAAGANCVAVPGATSTAYPLTRDDIGSTMRFQVIATSLGGDSQPAVSPPTGVVQRGVITARLSISPNPSCTGAPTVLDGSRSVSPDGIKSYSFSFIDLYAAAYASNFPETEGQATFGAILEAESLRGDNGSGAQNYLINNFDGSPLVSDKPTVTETLDWNRPVIFNPDDPQSPSPYDLARDPVGVLLIVTDYSGATAQAVGVLNFAQHLSSDSRSKCPKMVKVIQRVSKAELATELLFSKGSSKPSTTARCTSHAVCVGAITVLLRKCRSCARDAVRHPTPELATGFFRIPPHRKRRVVLTLTKRGRHLLHHGARVPVIVTVVSISPTGRSIRQVYTEVLKR
jgi:hypothetical protein